MSKCPIEYQLSPTSFSRGEHQLKLELKNLVDCQLKDLIVRLNSLDTYGVEVVDSQQKIRELASKAVESLSFSLKVHSSAAVYLTLDGKQDSVFFHWETPAVELRLKKTPAELASLFCLASPYPTVGRGLRIEAGIKPLKPVSGLSLEWWVKTPEHRFEQVDVNRIKRLDRGKIVRRVARYQPEKAGIYTFYTYLFRGSQRLDWLTEKIWAEKA